MARTKKDIFGGSKPAVNMSPMIDLVFLLLIFFMVASKMVTVPTIAGLEIPVADEAKVPKNAQGRIVININTDGEILNSSGTQKMSIFDVEQTMAAAKRKNPKVKLHLRVDKGVEHKAVNDVIRASTRGGVSEVIFSSYTN